MFIVVLPLIEEIQVPKKIISILDNKKNRILEDITLELECKIDSDVFKLFEMPLEDIKYILKYLKISEKKKGIILDYL